MPKYESFLKYLENIDLQGICNNVWELQISVVAGNKSQFSSHWCVKWAIEKATYCSDFHIFRMFSSHIPNNFPNCAVCTPSAQVGQISLIV